MPTISVQNLVEGGLSPTYASADAGGDTFANASGERSFIHVKNADASPHTVTIAANAASYNIPGIGALTKSDIEVTVPAGEDRFIGPIPVSAFGTAPDIQYDAVTDVTIAVLRVPQTG